MERSILIADDEEMIRKGIIARLEYLGLSSGQLYQAENGLKALEIMESNHVDIVLTDIRMPDMDGLDFIRRAKERNPNVQFIIISGHAEFGYAEQAIRLGVNDYLLKPISNEALKKALEEAESKLDERKKNRLMMMEGTRTIAEKRNYQFEKIVNELLQSRRDINEAKGTIEIADREMPLLNRQVMLALVNIDEDHYEQKKFGCRDMELLQFAVKNVFLELSASCSKTIVSNHANLNQLYVILSDKKKGFLRKEAEKVLAQLQNILSEQMGISLTIGIGPEKDYLAADSVQEAQEALLQKMVHGPCNLYFYDDICQTPARSFPSTELNLLSQYIERSDAMNIEIMLNEIFSDDKVKDYNAAYIRLVLIRIISILHKAGHMSSVDESGEGNIEKLALNAEKLSSFRSLKELRDYLYALILQYIRTDEDADTHSKNKIKQAVRYINENFNRDIPINELAERYGMSANYFCTSFKRETGQTTVNYIKDLRIKKACEYLASSETSVVEIANKVGYEDGQYFFRVFKKATGQTPLQYRRNCIQ